jgi:hypothetical protein
MGEWSTYSLEDLLMFSARTFDRLVERHNRELWPWHLAALAVAAAVVLLLLRRDGRANRLAAALVSAGWAGAGWLWLAQRFATIQTGGGAMAWAFAVEAALLAWAGVARGRLALPARLDGASRSGVALLAYGLFLHPLVAPLIGRPWTRAELFAVTADPTAAATLGLLLAARAPWYLWPIPIAWCLFAGALHRALAAPAWWALPAIAAVAAALALARRRRG